VVTAVLRAEWTKLRTVCSTGWTVILILALTVGFSLLLASGSSSTPPGAGGDNDIVRDSLVGVYLAQFAVVAFGVLAFTSEYATGLIHVTFAAMPRRGRVLAAKALLVGVTVLVAGLAATATSFVAGQRVLRDNGYSPPGYPEWTLHDGAAQRAVLGSALLLAAIALLALGIGAIFRHSAAAISSLLALLFVPLIFGPLLPERTGALLQKATPGAGFAVQQTVARDDAIPIAPWAGLGVAFAWAGGALFLAYFLIRRRDA
jgi:ABC-2 type transport system permease protein